MEQLLTTLSAAHVFIKFVKCKAGDALKNYPDSQCPTLLVYRGGSVLKQFIKFDSFGGAQATSEGTCPGLALAVLPCPPPPPAEFFVSSFAWRLGWPERSGSVCWHRAYAVPLTRWGPGCVWA